MVVVFQVAGRLLVVGVAPVEPTLGADEAAQVAVHEEGVGIGAPGPSEIFLVDTRGGGERAAVEDVAVRLVGRRGGCGDVAVGLAEDVAMLKPCRARAKDEVGGALDVAVLEVEACAAYARVDGVLVAQEAAVDKYQPVAFGVQGHGLSEAGGIVLDGDVPECDVAALDLEGVGAEGAHGLAVVGALDVGVVVVGDDGVVAVFATNLDVGEP